MTNRTDFMDEVWERYSKFHDSTLRNISIDVFHRALTMELKTPVYNPDGHISGYANCKFVFDNVNHVSIKSKKPTYEGSNYVFPVNAAVDLFYVSEYDVSGGALGDVYELRGIYEWSIEWIASGFKRIITDDD